MSAMFKREDGGDEIETVIGPSVHVEGDFVAAGDVVIEGVVSGNVRTERNLRIGEGAKLFADVSALNASIAGEVQGNVRVQESLELAPTAKIFGDVKAKILTINGGAVVHGRCSVGDERKSKLEKIEDREKNRQKVKEVEPVLQPVK